jgi:DNA-binding NarL/FixJ family response regulator
MNIGFPNVFRREAILEKIRVLVVGKGNRERGRIVELLTKQDDFTVSCVGDSLDLVSSVKKLQPHVIIMDFFLDGIGSIDLVPMMRRLCPSGELVLLCSDTEHVALEKVFRSGISGYLLRQHDFANLPMSVRCVVVGGLYISSGARDQVLDCFPGISGHNRHKHGMDFKTAGCIFTRTELQIFQGIVLGHSDSKIAGYLNISPDAVRNCNYQAKKKIGMQNRTQISIFALSMGLISMENETPKKHS